MELYQIVLFGLTILAIVVGGYTFMFFHIIRLDPKEQKYREQSGYDKKLLPKKKVKSSTNKEELKK